GTMALMALKRQQPATSDPPSAATEEPALPSAAELPALIARSAEGDVQAFERLIAAYQPKVFRFALAFAATRDQASDLAQEALIRVPAAYRAVVVMFDVEGLSYDEIATALAVPVGTVKSRLKRGRDALRVELFRVRAADEGPPRGRPKEDAS